VIVHTYWKATRHPPPPQPRPTPKANPINYITTYWILFLVSADRFTFNEFWKAVKKHANNSDIQIGDNKSREWANFYINKNFVENTGTEKRMIIQRVNEPC
jgi:hypothetical protein